MRLSFLFCSFYCFGGQHNKVKSRLPSKAYHKEVRIRVGGREPWSSSNVCLKRPKINEKDAGVRPFFKKRKRVGRCGTVGRAFASESGGAKVQIEPLSK